MADPELAKALKLSLAQAGGVESESKVRGDCTTPRDVSDTKDGEVVPPVDLPPGAIDALASERYGRWFSFDDRKVWRLGSVFDRVYRCNLRM